MIKLDYSKANWKISNEEIETLLSSAKARIESKKTEKARIEAEKARIQKEKQIEQAKKELERQLKKSQKELEKQKQASEKVPRTRAVIQMNDDGSIVNEFVSIAEAVTKTGVNSKSIRDAANGVQKHAGGFCWKFKEIQTEE